MKTIFTDLENKGNPVDGAVITNSKEVHSLFANLKIEIPFMCTFESENGCFLTAGVGEMVACVQYTNSARLPPYVMALGDGAFTENQTFYMSGSPTEVHAKFCITMTKLIETVSFFVENGKIDSSSSWEKV